MSSRIRSPLPVTSLAALFAGLLLAAPAAAEPVQEPPAVETKAGPGEDEGPVMPLEPVIRKTTTKIRLGGLSGGKLIAGKRVSIKGTVRPFAPGEKVTVLIKRGKKTYKRVDLAVHRKSKRSKLGQFKFSKRLVRPGAYSVRAQLPRGGNRAGSGDSSRRFKIKFPSLRKGDRGPEVRTLNKLLAKLGYVNDEGRRYDGATGRAVLAFRKVNRMARTEKASGKIFKKLARGKGGFKLRHPGAGKHVEADLSRQVMVLARGKKVEEIYHVSSGAPATPTILGKYRFYRKDPGYNSLGMYYSVYFIRGYAIHGYKSVPTYPASHGCLRNPIPDSKHIYDWVDIGDPIYVYP
jgi:hypothetical protein